MKVGIIQIPDTVQHSTSWNFPWIDYCKKLKHNYTILNPFKNEILEDIEKVDIVLWHFSGYNYTEMLIARSILYASRNMGKIVYPDFNDSWHFDDKVAETYLLQSVKAPMPKSFMFYSLAAINNFTINFNNYPIIAKLRNGSGSHNVKKIKSKDELLSYAKKMFTKGINSAPSLMYKASSNIKSSKNLKILIKRAKRIPEFLRTLSNAKKFNIERGYVFLQEFIPNDGYDLKIVVVGDKLSFIGRNIRQGEFRASGGGDMFYDKDKVTQNIIDSAFKTSDVLGFNCMGYDYVINKNTGEGKIIEISYGFSHHALLEAKGYFDRSGIWHSQPLNAPEEVLKNLLSE